MSLHWNIIEGFLYAEIAAILVLQFFSNRALNKLFRSRLIQGLQGQVIYYFYFMVTGLVLLYFLDAIREMRKYSDENHPAHFDLDTQMELYTKLFWAQKNLYISGSSLFLCL